jgi:hypothetical protein
MCKQKGPTAVEIYQLLICYCIVPEKIHTPPHRGNFCRPEGEGETKLFLIIVNVLGHPKGVGGLTSNFLWGWYGCFLE